MALPAALEQAGARYRRARLRIETSRPGNLAALASRRFTEIDGRSRIAAITLDVFVAMLPLAVIGAAFASANPHSHGYGTILVRRLGLHGRAAREILHAFPVAAATTRAANILAIAGFLIAGFDLTNALQATYDAAWQVTERMASWKATLRGAAWLALGGIFGLYLTTAGPGFAHHTVGRIAVELLVVAPAGVLFWLFTPRVLLSRREPWHAFLPGAVLSTVGLIALQASSSLFLPATLDQYIRLFGSIGLAIALLFWLWLVAFLWVGGAVLSAVLWERQRHDLQHSRQQHSQRRKSARDRSAGRS